MSTPLRALIVEDSPDDAALILRELGRAGYEVVSERVETSESMNAALDRESWDVILSDYTMPRFSALHALEVLKSHQLDIPFIIISGTIGEETAVNAMKAGAQDFLTKGKLARLIPALERELAEAQTRQQRREAQESWRQSEERFREIAEAIDEVFWIANPEITRMLYVSPAYERVWGRSIASLYENPTAFLELVAAEDRERVTVDLESRKTGQAFDHEYRIVRPDGAIRWIWDRGIPVRDKAGQVVRYVGVALDITGRKLLEDQFRQAQKMEAVGRLAGGVAHDFNNLLTVINGYSEMTLDSLPAADPARQYLEEVKKAGNQAAFLTRQLLAFSRQHVLAPQVLDLNAVLADVEKMLRRLIGEDVDLAVVQGSGLGRVKADPGEINQIIVNLAVNSRDAMPRGGKLTIETSNVELDTAYAEKHPFVASGRYVMLAVSDTGIGMDPETQAHIFEPFFTTKEKGKGTGLGLAMVYGTVKQSGGFIWVYSEAGKGTTFKIYLPRLESGALSYQLSGEGARSLAGTETVLLLEDDQAVRALVTGNLRSFGYNVLASGTPEDALQIGERFKAPIDLLLTDVVLPRMSGPQVAEQLAVLRPGLKVLYMSGYTDNAIVRHEVLEASAAFLQKPFTPKTLARQVRDVLDKRRTGSS